MAESPTHEAYGGFGWVLAACYDMKGMDAKADTVVSDLLEHAPDDVWTQSAVEIQRMERGER
ncbi:MAG: hypothetical protein GY913_27880 [Proteobacteria bacterium]|nr:hypothetical protein [Pseudomonadota bacterium]MCP4920730.1 hypothetical protein [Pseudomonadota bacterium]